MPARALPAKQMQVGIVVMSKMKTVLGFEVISGSPLSRKGRMSSREMRFKMYSISLGWWVACLLIPSIVERKSPPHVFNRKKKIQ
jgi:hypothetical protein